MFCKYCGKQINVNDKFCPYCGKSNTSTNVKTINIDSGITTDSLRKRAFNLIEDGESETAKAYLDRLLDLQPDDAQGYLGLLIIEKGVHNKNELIKYYKELFNDEHEEVKTVRLSEKDTKHINSIIDKYSIPFYLDKDTIFSLYREFDSSYLSLTPSIEKQNDNIDNEFENNIKLSRLMINADKQLRKDFNEIKNDYKNKLANSHRQDEEKETRIKEDYKDFVKKTDETVKKMHGEALKRREEDYEEYSNKIINSSQISELNDLKSSLLLMGDYKEAELRVKECDEKIAEIEKTLKEEKEIADQKRKRNITRILAVAAIAAVVLLIYQFAIVPENKYKEGLAFLESGDYESAISTFQELNNYKDSNNQLNIALLKKAESLIHNEKYKEAVDILTPIQDEQDVQDTMNEAKYGLAIQLTEEKKYDEAIAIFDTIAEYKDVSSMKMKTIYEKAIYLRDNKNYDEALKLFDQIIEYEDATEQKTITEQIKKENSVTIPKIVGKSLYDVGISLERLGLTYKTIEKESQYDKAGLVVGVSPAEETMLYKGSEVELTITRGLSKYDDYRGNGNRNVLYQVNITPAVKQIIVRTSPHIVTTNKTGTMAKSGEPYNVYETVYNEGYTWIRTEDNTWFATESGWIEQDAYCTNRGDYKTVKAWIKASDGSGVYDRPVENANERNWVDHLEYGSEITIYYRFNSGGHNWYKIGANRWIKDVYGEKVAYY